MPALRTVLLHRGHLAFPLVLLLYLVMKIGTSPFRAAIYAIAATAFASWVRPHTRLTPQMVGSAVVDAGKRTVEIGATCAASGIIVGVLSLTGLGANMSMFLVDIAGSSQFAILIMTTIACLVLGMGMPTIAAFAICASVLSPAIVATGVIPLQAHMFVFYYAVLASITPPVALASFAAASLARAPLWSTALQATRMSAAGFFIPFMIVYRGSILVGQAGWDQTALGLAMGCLGTLSLAAAVNGHLLRRTHLLERCLLALGAALLGVPGQLTDVVGVGLVACVGLFQRRWSIGRPS